MKTLSDVVASIHEASDSASLKAAVAVGFANAGFPTYQLAANVKSRDELMFTMLQTSPEGFLKDYDKLGIIGDDPILDGIFRRKAPFCFNTMDLALGKYGQLGKRWSDFFRTLKPIAGVVIPLPSTEGRVSAAVVSSTRQLSFDEPAIAEASIIARVAVLKAETLGLTLNERSLRLADAGLSTHQMEVLQWAAQGKSNADIGVIMGQSKRAIDYHVSEILRKLGVSSRSQAIAITRGHVP